MSSSLEELTKTAPENRLFDMNFTKQLASGETPASIVSVVAISSNIVSGSSLVIIGDSSIGGNIVQIRISEGTQYEQYTILITITTTLGNTLVGSGLLRIE